MKGYRRYYRRYWPRSNRVKWSSNFAEGTVRLEIPANNTTTTSASVCKNPVQSVNSVSQPFTTARVTLNIQAVAETPEAAQALGNVKVGIFYVPQGYSVSNSLFIEHPEWLMGYRFLGEPIIDIAGSSTIMRPFTVATRLKRRLQTGDSIVLLIAAYNQSATTAYSIRFNYTARWWTKAN